MNPTVEAAKNGVGILVDEQIFPRQVVLAAAYMFLDRCYVRLERSARRAVLVRLKGKKKISGRRLATLSDEFENELLHQLIRHQVAERTDQLREMIVGRALLSAVPPEDTERESADEDLDYLDDPLGIAVPWEEKYGSDKKEN